MLIIAYFCLVIDLQGSSSDGENILRLVRDFITGCNGEQVRFATTACKYSRILLFLRFNRIP